MTEVTAHIAAGPFRSFTSTFWPINRYSIKIVLNLVRNNRMKGFEIVSVDGIVVWWGIGASVLQVHRLLAPRVLPRGLRLLPGRKALQVFLGKDEYKLSSLLRRGFVKFLSKQQAKGHEGRKKFTKRWENRWRERRNNRKERPRGLQRHVVYLGWPIAPSYMSPNAGGEGELRGFSQWVQLYTGSQINFGDRTPTYGKTEAWSNKRPSLMSSMDMETKL